MKGAHSSVYCTDITLSLWDTASINLSMAAFDSTECCVLSIISTLHIHHTVHPALSHCDGRVARLPGSWPAHCGMFTVMLSQNALLVWSCLDSLGWATFYTECFGCLVVSLCCWPVASWTQRVQKKGKQSGVEGAETVINCQSQGSI